MTESLRVTTDDLRRRMDAGEKFTIIDVRNPTAWAESTDMATGAIRIALDNADKASPQIPRDRPIVVYCT